MSKKRFKFVVLDTLAPRSDGGQTTSLPSGRLWRYLSIDSQGNSGRGAVVGRSLVHLVLKVEAGGWTFDFDMSVVSSFLPLAEHLSHIHIHGGDERQWRRYRYR